MEKVHNSFNHPRMMFANKDNDGIIEETTGEILQEHHYYPFGLELNGPWNNYGGDDSRYRYNGKEFSEELGLYDYGARWYDPAVARWSSIDPLAEEYVAYSPYNYVLGNPIRYLDPDGMRVEGVSKDDAEQVVNDLHDIFAGDKFSNLRALIKRTGKKGKGRAIASIGSDDLTAALNGVELTKDEAALVSEVTGAINSEDVHKVEYVDSDESLSTEGGNAFVDYINSVQEGFGDGMRGPDGKVSAQVILNGLGGEGFNVPTGKGSHSYIIEGPGATHSAGRSTTMGHEVVGHGVASGRGASNQANNTRAIRTDNLIRRVKGLPTRDGSNHAGGKVVDPNALPKRQ
ncbi:RHS repeat-associated core domain-containing protein [Neolewinella persica]|uniref:RHS repeat-associated core domain-containing protein n=1 Tax=Neolewinella persica TaxID=70998 RepID=UPI000367B668|nr:RHS repeat-associated core domain-containing protein [Neolewinella persica]